MADAIESLRNELTAAVERGRDGVLRFSVDPIELTMQVVLTKEANGKVGWKLIGLGGSVESATTQTVTLRLTPLWEKTDGSLTRDFAIASAGEAGDRVGPRD